MAERSEELIVKYNKNHDKLGRFSSGGGDTFSKLIGSPTAVDVRDHDGSRSVRIGVKALVGEDVDPRFASYPGQRRGDKDVGHILWFKETGVVEGILAHPEFQRKGVATALLAEARRYAESKGYPPVIHSDKQTADDAAWASVAKYNPYHDSKGRFASKGSGSARSSSLSVQQARQAKLGATRNDKSMNVSRAMMERIVSDGGFTLDPLSSASARSGLSVGIAPDRSGHWGPGKVTPRAIDSWVRKNADKLSQPNTRVGGWLDADTGDVWLDVVRVFPRGSEHSARLTAHNLNQIAMFSLHTGDTLNTMGTGSWPAPAGAIVWKSKRKSPMVLCIFDPSTPSIDIYKWAARKGVQQ